MPPAPTPRELRREPFGAQIREIASDAALMRYGAALGLVEAVTMVWLWRWRALLVTGEPALCWPFFQGCAPIRAADLAVASTGVVAVALLSLLACAAFLLGRARAGYTALLLAGLAKIALVLLDFRLRRNQHYMAVAVWAVFLFWPYKRDAIRLLIVGFYFAAGLLKLDAEWISGAALPEPVWLFEGPWLVAACIYVVVLEIVVVFGVLARRDWIFWGSLAQLAVFHLFSYSIVGFFYPVLMALLLAIYPLCRWNPSPGHAGASLLSRVRRGQVPRPVYVPLAVFAALQVVPYLYPGDSALTGEGRILALHMFDSQTVCERELTLTLPGGAKLRRELVAVPTRIHCDPWVLYSGARDACRERAADPTLGIERVSMKLASRRSSDPRLHVIVDEDRVCERGLTYDWWRHNAWIRVGPGGG